MTLLTPDQEMQLFVNGIKKALKSDFDPMPVVKLYTLFAPAVWLLTERCPADIDLYFGLCDLGQGCPEIGFVHLSELEALRKGPIPIVASDLSFTATAPISVYAEKARIAGQIVT